MTDFPLPSDMLRLFLVGCPRSGTTLLQSLLAAHSQITSFTESHFFYKGFSGFGGWRYSVRRRLASLVKDFLKQNCPGADSANFFIHKAPKHVSDTAAALIRLLDDCAKMRHASIWVEKTPNHVFRIPLITNATPSARFIHIIRRPEGVIPSLYKASQQWGRSKTWTECVVHWILAMKVSSVYMKDPNHYILPYEHLVENPFRELHKLLNWLGLEWEENILNTYSTAASGLIQGQEFWKTSNFSEISNKNVHTLDELPLTVRMFVKIFNYYDRLIRELQ